MLQWLMDENSLWDKQMLFTSVLKESINSKSYQSTGEVNGKLKYIIYMSPNRDLTTVIKRKNHSSMHDKQGKTWIHTQISEGRSSSLKIGYT